MTESQIWSDYFAVWEADQLRRHPIATSFTPLEQAQYKLALDYLRNVFPLHKLRETRQKLGPLSSEDPIVFRADAPTRRAFFEHFEDDRVINIFCWRNEERKSIAKSTRRFSYSIQHHIFDQCSTMESNHLKMLWRAPLPQDIPLDELFVRDSGSYIGPLAASGEISLCHWNAQQLVQLTEYQSMWVA